MSNDDDKIVRPDVPAWRFMGMRRAREQMTPGDVVASVLFLALFGTMVHLWTSAAAAQGGFALDQHLGIGGIVVLFAGAAFITQMEGRQLTRAASALATVISWALIIGGSAAAAWGMGAVVLYPLITS